MTMSLTKIKGFLQNNPEWAIFPVIIISVYLYNKISIDKHFILTFFSYLRENLPLTLPILSIILSVMLNIREVVKRGGWAKLSLPVSLGLVSFSIWYLVTTESLADENFIRVGANSILKKDYASLLLIISFIWAAFVGIVLSIPKKPEDGIYNKTWNVIFSVLLSVSLFGLTIPFFLLENKKDYKSVDYASYKVVIPYTDSSISVDYKRCEIQRIESANSYEDAIEQAKSRFMNSERSYKVGRHSKDEKVTVENYDIVVQKEQKKQIH